MQTQLTAYFHYILMSPHPVVNIYMYMKKLDISIFVGQNRLSL